MAGVRFSSKDKVHLSQLVGRGVNIGWYLEGARGAKWEEILAEQSPSINEERNKNHRAICDCGLSQHCLCHCGRGGTSLGFPLPRGGRGAPCTSSPMSAAKTDGVQHLLSLGPENTSHFILQNKHVSIKCYCCLHEIKYLNQRKILFVTICKYRFNHKLNLKATLSVCDCYLVSIIKVPWKN